MLGNNNSNDNNNNLYNIETGKKQRFIGVTPIPRKYKSSIKRRDTNNNTGLQQISLIESLKYKQNRVRPHKSQFDDVTKKWKHGINKDRIEKEYQERKRLHELKLKRLNESKVKEEQKRLYPKTLIMPYKFDILLTKFVAFETSIQMYNDRSVFCIPFDDIKNSVQIITKKTFKLADLQQIWYIFPKYYNISYKYVSKHHAIKKEWKLCVTAIDYDPTKSNNNNNSNDDEKANNIQSIGTKFMTISKRNKRKKYFEYYLIKYIAKVHNKWIKDNILIEFDPLIRGEWHKNFDLDSITDIPLKNIDKINLNNNNNKITKIIKKNEINRDNLIKKERQRIVNKINKYNTKSIFNRINESENESESEIPIHLRHLSPSIIARIKTKEKLNNNNNTSKTINNKIISVKSNKIDDAILQNRYQKMPYYINLIRGIYVSLKKSSMEYGKLVELTQKRHKNPLISKQEIYDQLNMLSQLKYTIFTIKQGNSIKIAKFNKNADMKPLYKYIQSNIK